MSTTTSTTSETRQAYLAAYKRHLVMTENELEERLNNNESLAKLDEASTRNAESIRSAQISYGGYN